MLRYAITDRRMFAGDERGRRAALLVQAERLARAGVDVLQLREKDLSREELVGLAREIVAVLHAVASTRANAPRTKLFLNAGGLLAAADAIESASPQEAAERLQRFVAESAADGLHLPDRWSPTLVLALRNRGIGQVVPSAREAGRREASGAGWLSVACHSPERCATAAQCGADLLLFSPVFGKQADGTTVVAAGGLERLHEAARAAAPVPVVALGGVSAQNSAACLQAGAAGVAGIRLFL